MKLSIIMPVYNEQATLTEIVNRVRLVDASGTPEEVTDRLIIALEDVLP